MASAVAEVQDENRAMQDSLVNITCPVTVIHGTWDPVCPYEGTVSYLRGALVNARALRFRTLERTGHNIHLSWPQVIWEELDRLIHESAPPHFGEPVRQSG